MNAVSKNLVTINSRPYTVYGPHSKEDALHPHLNYLFDLSYMRCLAVIGANGRAFLQGQLSCDVREVTSYQMRQGALCNLKGRILALLDVVDWQGLCLILPDDLLDATQRSLTTAAALSKVKLVPSIDYELFGFYLQNPSDNIPFEAKLPHERHQMVHEEQYACYHLGDKQYLFIVDKTSASSIRESFIQHEQWVGSFAWHKLQLQHSRIEIYPESRGLFLPHRLGLDRSGHLHFNKGCYKGQEIIARMHYRSNRTHSLRSFVQTIDLPIHSGQRLLNQQSVEIGELIDFCPLNQEDNQYLCVASLKLEDSLNNALGPIIFA